MWRDSEFPSSRWEIQSSYKGDMSFNWLYLRSSLRRHISLQNISCVFEQSCHRAHGFTFRAQTHRTLLFLMISWFRRLGRTLTWVILPLCLWSCHHMMARAGKVRYPGWAPFLWAGFGFSHIWGQFRACHLLMAADGCCGKRSVGRQNTAFHKPALQIMLRHSVTVEWSQSQTAPIPGEETDSCSR